MRSIRSNSSVKKSIRNNRGFSLIELMAIMIVVGTLSAIAIGSASSMISRSKKEKVSQNMKNVTMAAKMYVQNNRDLLPRNIGEEKIIKLSVLKDSNYLKETVTNDDGESCMNESLVRVYKLSNSEYTYTPFLYCGEEKAPAKVEIPGPEISGFSFSNTKDVSKANFSFKIKGNPAGTGEIYSYTYAILVKNNNTPDFTEVFSSGSVSGNNKKEISFESKPLIDYIDVTGYSMVKVRVTAINRDGGSNTADSSSVGAGATLAYNDTVKPECVAGGTIGDAKDDKDWINKENIDTEKYPRIISVKCTDGNGSGCKRDLFSDSWPDQENYVFGTKFANVKIEDNAVMDKDGKLKEPNSNFCRVRVNADVKSPRIDITVVNPAAGKAKENKTFTVNEDGKDVPDKTYPKADLTADSYVNQKGDTIKWLNAEYYPEGIKFKVKITDNIYLYKYTWETNPSYIRGGSSKEEITAKVSLNNPDGGKTEKILVPNDNAYLNSDTGLLEYNFEVSLKDEGMRYGVLRVYDKAGNYTEAHIYANIDRTAPAVPSNLYQKADSKKAYQGNADWVAKNLIRDAWSTEHVFAYIQDQQEDHESNNTELSGWKEFRYIYSKQTGISRNGLNVSGYTFKDTNETVCTDKDGAKKVGYIMKDEGTHTIKFKSCDKAENCSPYNNDTAHNPYPYVKIDTIAPTCQKVELVHPNGNPLCVDDNPTSGTCSGSTAEAKSKGWLGYKDNVYNMNTTSNEKKTAIVYAVCRDSDTQYASLCDGLNNYSFGLPSEGKKTATSSIPTDSAVKALYDREIRVFPQVMQPYKHYQEDMDVTNAGATGVGNPGKVVDIAGNVTDCTKMYTVRIDYTRPTCKATTTKSNNNGSSWQSYNGDSDANYGWLGVGWKIKYSTEAVDGTKNGASSGNWTKYSNFETVYEKEIHSVKRATTNRSNGHAFVVPLYVYDKAGNRSATHCEYKSVKLDFTGPSCEVSAKVTGSSNNTYWKYSGEGKDYGSYKQNDWLNIGYGVSVRKKCADDTITKNEDTGANTKVGSGCDGSSFTHDTLAPSNLGDNIGTYKRGAESGTRNSKTDAKSGTVTDRVGNPQSCQVIEVNYDNQMPTCTVTRSKTHYQLHSKGSQQWNNRADGVTVSSTCADGSGSGCNSTTCNTQDDANGQAQSYNDTCLQASTKSHKYSVREGQLRTITNGGSVAPGVSGYVVDGVGNTDKSGRSKCSATQSVKIDDEDPKCINETRTNLGVYNSGWNNGAGVKITSGCADGSGSGCMNTSCNTSTSSTTCSGCQNASNKSCTFRGTNQTKKWATGTAGAYSTTSGGWVEDQVGNKSADCKHNFNVWIDDVKPNCVNETANPSPLPLNISTNWTTSNRTISWGCQDPTEGSGCTKSSDSRTYTTTTHTGTLQFTDRVNNTVSCGPGGSYRVNVDKTPPTATFDGIQYNNKSNLPNNSWVLYELGERIQLKGTIRDADSGILRYCWGTGPSSCSSGWKQVGSDSNRVTSLNVTSEFYDRNQTVYLIVEDRVGLKGYSSFRIDRFGVKRTFTNVQPNPVANTSKGASAGYLASYSGSYYSGSISSISDNKRALECTASAFSGSNGSITHAYDSATGSFSRSASCSASGSSTTTSSTPFRVTVSGGGTWTESYKDTMSEQSDKVSSETDYSRCKTCRDGYELNYSDQCDGIYGPSYELRGEDHQVRLTCLGDDGNKRFANYSTPVSGYPFTPCTKDHPYGYLYERTDDYYNCSDRDYFGDTCNGNITIWRYCYARCTFKGASLSESCQEYKKKCSNTSAKLINSDTQCGYCKGDNTAHTTEYLSSDGYTCTHEYYPTRQKASYSVSGSYVAAA